MPQNSDPFDEFRMKKVISNLESGFRHSAKKKRKRLKELLEEDDGGDPDAVEVRVQEEMESFFKESTSAAESVFAEIGQGGAADTAEIQQRIDDVLRPVEAASIARREPPPPPSPRDRDDLESPNADDIREALARLGGRVDRRAAENGPSDGDALPDWLDAEEERIGDPGSVVENDEERQRRILGAFDTSFDRLRSLIRDSLNEAEREAREEYAQEEAARAECAREEAARESEDPPLARRPEGEGFGDETRAVPEPVAEPEPEPEGEPETPAAAEAPGDLAARVEALEREVARLRRILAINGLARAETA
jgi:hypothetical protein